MSHDKRYANLLFILKNVSNNISDIRLSDFDENEIYGMLINMSNSDLIHLGKREAYISDVGALYLKEFLQELKDELRTLLDSKLNDVIKAVDITTFMVKNFIKPNLRSDKTTNDTDFGVYFIKYVKSQESIHFDEETLNHVNSWYIDNPPTIKRWFDTLDKPLLISIGNQFLVKDDFNQPIKKQIRNDSKLPGISRF